jgi:sec-independent protein translocase protein TatA
VDVGPAELLIVLAVVLLLFGSKKLPELARGMGQASREFRKGLHFGDDDEPTESPSAADDTATPSNPASDPPA